MTLSECACVKPFQSPLGAYGHNTPSLLTTVASGAGVNKLGDYYTWLTLFWSFFPAMERLFFLFFFFILVAHSKAQELVLCCIRLSLRSRIFLSSGPTTSSETPPLWSEFRVRKLDLEFAIQYARPLN